MLLLDEPSSGIAQKETEALGARCSSRVQRRARLQPSCVIEHDMPLIPALADRIVALDAGRVVADGTPDEVLNHPQVVESYLGTTRRSRSWRPLTGLGVTVGPVADLPPDAEHDEREGRDGALPPARARRGADPRARSA